MLFVGTGKASIDPSEDMLPMGTRFATCEAIYDSCFVRALALDNGKTKAMLVVYELSDQPVVDGLQKALAEASGVPEENIVIAVTHNHSSPCDDAFRPEDPFIAEGRIRYKKIELEAGVMAARQAAESMRPARWGYGEIRSNINTCRDLETPFGYWVEGRNVDAYSDKTLSVMKFVDEEGKLIAALLNHPTHATNIYLMKDFDGKTKLSGNFPGITCRFVEEHYGNGAVCLWTSGAAGDQNPLLSHGMQYEYADGYSTAVPYPDGVGYMQMEFTGRTHGADAVRGIDSIKAESTAMPIGHFDLDVALPAQKRVETGKKTLVNKMVGNVHNAGLREEPYTAPVLPPLPEVEDDPDHPIPLRMQLLKLGNVAVLCAGCELYASIGAHMKEQSPYRRTIILTHTKDYRHVGYVMGRDDVGRKVFQAFGPVKPGEAEDVILAGEKSLFEAELEKE